MVHQRQNPFEAPQNHPPHEHHDQHERHAHLHPQHHDFKAVGHNRQQQSHHDSAAMVKAGHLPPVDFNHDHGPTTKPHSDGTRASNHPEKLDNGMVKFGQLKGAAVDTDGSGAHRHKEDRTRQSETSFKPDGKSLDTDKDKFVALPKSVMKEHGLQLGDKGFLVRSDTGQKVPVVFGDVSSGKQWKNGQPEASVAALKELGFNDVNGARGVEKNVGFQLIMAPGSKGKALEA